jgi:hypothetical protein
LYEFSISRFIITTDRKTGKIIACLTFIAVWWDRGTNPRVRVKSDLVVASFVVFGSWIFVALLVLVPARIYNKPSDLYFAPTPVRIHSSLCKHKWLDLHIQVWCTINKNYELVRLFAKYLWLWLAFLLSFLLYIPLGLWSRGYVTPDPTIWWKFHLHRRRDVRDEQHRRHLFLATIAYASMLCINFYMTLIRTFFSYPLSNAILIGPLSIVRWMQNTGSNISSEEGLDVGAVFALSGVTNVLLFLLIRPNLLLFRRDDCCNRCSKMESTTLPSSALASSMLTPPAPEHVQPTESVEMVYRG